MLLRLTAFVVWIEFVLRCSVWIGYLWCFGVLFGFWLLVVCLVVCLFGCFLCSLVVFCGFCFALLDCYVNSVVLGLCCVFVLFDALNLIVYWSWLFVLWVGCCLF